MEGKITALLKSIDTFCARLNAGLAAVAVVLSLLVAAELTAKVPPLIEQAVATQGANLVANTQMGPSTTF